MKQGLWLACVFLLVSCAKSPDVRQLACPPVEGVEQVLAAPGVFIGDMHGTVESPAFLAALACHVLKSGRALVVAMEYDAQDQAVLEQFLATRDVGKAATLLTSTPHWTSNRDGRASTAMRDALVAIHGLAAAGGNVELVAYDLRVATWQERDPASAEYIRQKRANGASADFWILYGGNVHARKTKGLPFTNAPPDSEDHEPLGYLIRDWGLVHLNVAYRGGAGWGCRGPTPEDCSVLELGPACTLDCPLHPVIRLDSANPAYDGVYDVGRMTVSRPLYWR